MSFHAAEDARPNPPPAAFRGWWQGAAFPLAGGEAAQGYGVRLQKISAMGPRCCTQKLLSAPLDVTALISLFPLLKCAEEYSGPFWQASEISG